MAWKQELLLLFCVLVKKHNCSKVPTSEMMKVSEDEATDSTLQKRQLETTKNVDWKGQNLTYVGNMSTTQSIGAITINLHRPDYNHLNSNLSQILNDDNKIHTNVLIDLMMKESKHMCQGQLCKENTTWINYNLCIGSTCSYCQCDAACWEYDECCLNSHFANKKSSQTYECVSRYVKGVSGNTKERYYMITKCPKKYKGAEMAECEAAEPKHNPVTDSRTHRTYRNTFCARCNNVSIFTPWKINITCNGELDLSNVQTPEEVFDVLMKTGGCNIFYELPANLKPRECFYRTPISECNATGKWPHYYPFYDNACKQFKTIYRINYMDFRNVFCAICNGYQPFGQRQRILSQSPGMVSVSKLLHFVTVDFTGIEDKCTSIGIYDPLKERCRIVLCPKGKIFENGECKIKERAPVIYQLFYSLTPTEALYVSETEKLTDLLEGLTSNIEDVTDSYGVIIVKKNIQAKLRGYASCDGVQSWNGTRRVQLSKFLLSWALYVNNLNSMSKLEEDLLKMATTKRKLHKFLGQNVTLQGEIDEEALVSHSAETSCFLNEATTFQTISASKTKLQFFVWTFNVSKFILCPQVQFGHEDVTFLNTGDISINGTNITFEKNEYSYSWGLDQVIVVCVDDFLRKLNSSFPNKTRENKLSNQSPLSTKSEKIKEILSLACSSVSLISLLLTLFTYLLFPSLQTAPGVNNMFLAATLFLAQGLFQFGTNRTEIQTICIAIGILNHFLWLSVVCWLSVCSFHMYHTFSAFRCSKGSNLFNKRLFFYVLYAFGCPGMIVGANILGNYFLMGKKNIGYGGPICYFNNASSLALSFALPLFLSIITNILFFVVTVIKIRKTSKIRKSSPSNQHHLLVYCKLSTLTGATWVFGLVAFTINYDPLWYPFIILNSLQGFFIFLSYICNGRILKMYCDKCSHKTAAGFGSFLSACKTESTKL